MQPPRSPRFPTTSSAPTKRASSPRGIRSAFCTSRAPRSTLPAGTDPYSPQVYQKARENLAALRERAPLVTDEIPSLYFYRLRMDGHEQIGVAGCFSIDEYEPNVIKKHERTRRDKEDDRTRHMIELRAQTGVVFLTYRADPAIDALARQLTAGEPLVRLHDRGRCAAHRVEGGADRDRRARGRVRADSGALHRRRTSPRGERGARACGAAKHTRRPRNPRTRSSPSRSPTIRCRSCPTTARSRISQAEPRTIPRRPAEAVHGDRRSAGAEPSGARVDVSRRTLVRDRPHRRPRGRRLAGERPRRRPPAAQRAGTAAGVGDVRTDKRIDFVGGARGTEALEAAVDSGKAAVAFSMFPVTVDDLMAISDAGDIMPPKSTWFEPKLRDGLLIHLI